MNILQLKRQLMPMGGFLSGGGSGGGGSGTGTQTSISELPEWARGYAKDTLEKGAALSEKPYQSYGQDRIAGFSPMQQQSQQNAANMQTNQGTGTGMGIAGAAALGGLNQNYQGGNFSGGRFGNDQASQYMSPYIEQAMAPQLREAQRSSDMQGQQNAAKAVGQGAFGGSRSGLVEAERQRNLGMQQGDIRAKGYQTAYEQAANQFNQDSSRGLTAQQLGEQSRQFGSNLGLQGLNTALQGANSLGQMGQQQFQQGMDINKLQNAYGGQQQALQQQGLSQAYDDFQNQNNFGYKQLGFMSDLIRGLPLGQQTATQMYTPNPSTAQQVGAAGAGLYGLSKFMAEGGMAYADGGSVDSPDNVASIVHTLSDQDLQKAMQAAQARGDQDQLEAIQNEMGMRASLKHGIAGGITPQMVQKMAGGGGVLAFAGDEDTNGPAGQLIVSQGNKKYYDDAGSYAMEGLDKLRNRKGYQGLSRADRDALEKETFDRLQKYGGEDPYGPMAEKIKQFEADRAKNYDRGLGFAALQAIPKMLEGGNAIRGIGGGLGAFGAQAEQVDRANASEKRSLAGMDFNLADAKRKERTALGREALSSVKDTEANRIAADAAERKAITDEITGASNLAKAYRPVGTGAGGAGGAGKVKLAEQLGAAEIAYENNPTDQTLKTVTALRRAVGATKDSGPGNLDAKVVANEIKLKGLVADELKNVIYTPAYVKGTPAEKQALEQQATDRATKKLTMGESSGNAGKLKFDKDGNLIK